MQFAINLHYRIKLQIITKISKKIQFVNGQKFLQALEINVREETEGELYGKFTR